MIMLALIVGVGDAGISRLEADSVSAYAAAGGYSSPVKVTGKFLNSNENFHPVG